MLHPHRSPPPTLPALLLLVSASGCLRRAAPDSGPSSASSSSVAATLASAGAGAEASVKACLPMPTAQVVADWEMVVLAPDTPLHMAPDAATWFVAGRHTPAHLLREADGWLEVEIGDNLGCYFDPAGLAGLKLRLWVRPDGLAPVVKATHTLSHDDGTALTLRAGLALLPTGEADTYRIVDQIATPVVQLPPEAVGHRYREEWSWYAPMELALVPSVMAQGAHLGGTLLPMLPNDDPWMWGRTEGAGQKATFASFCARYTTTLPAGAIDENAQGGLLFGISAPRAKAGYPLAPGAPIYWPDDRPAGETRCPEIFAVEVARSPAGRRCFVRDPVRGWYPDLSADAAGLVTLCFGEDSERSTVEAQGER